MIQLQSMERQGRSKNEEKAIEFIRSSIAFIYLKRG